MSRLLDWLRELLLGPPQPPGLEEERYPRDTMGRPDLSRFVHPASHYAGYVDEYLATLRPAASRGKGNDPAGRSYAYRKGVLGQWGLIARGPSESLLFVVRLLNDALPEARQTAAGVLDWWIGNGADGEIEAHALAAAEREAAQREPDIEALSGLIGILGRMRSQQALPILARVLRTPSASTGDLDWSAADAVAAIAGEAFDRATDRRVAADRWLRARGF
jgi:hypothetical protein